MDCGHVMCTRKVVTFPFPPGELSPWTPEFEFVPASREGFHSRLGN